MITVELKAAFFWICEECGRDNFCRGIQPDLSKEEEREAKERFGIEPWDDGQFITRPNTVTCEHCDTKFNCVDERE